MKIDRKELLHYGLFIFLSILFSFGLFALGKLLQKVNLNNLSLLGIPINFTVFPKYVVGLLQWALILTLFNKNHALHSLMQKGTWFVLGIIVCDLISMMMIKKHFLEWIGLELHGFFYASIRVIADTYAMILATIIHKFFNHNINERINSQ